ncbi:hypothetical protein [Pseudoalteromonas sp. S558]|uniref:hypothetical protein n=1 Tax=Pseudoalteromonas sp. S558 TaxID=2066515 RepID=UPI00110A0A5E|nr:hypothetical protein [Pseudoalteromonas sp. S558]TMN94674.1 hypothetical protein CWB66_19165 [Pseudoalteromonas sp. S558]
MPSIETKTLSVCIQALQAAIKHNDFLSQSETVDKNDYEESSYMYELELVKLIKLYKKEEENGVPIPLKDLLKPPLEELG